ncbi:MAG: (Na+)-NQR maturation NqrM [Pseudomonadota bacterium]
MTTILLAIVVVGLLMLGMAVGVLAGRKPIAGSCGGMKALGMDVECEICGGNPALCETETSNSGPVKASESKQTSNVVQTFDPDHTSSTR